MDLPGTFFFQIVGMAPRIVLLAAPFTAVGRKIYLEPLGLNRAVCSNKGFPLLYFKSALWPVQRNSLFRIGDVAAVLDNAGTSDIFAR